MFAISKVPFHLILQSDEENSSVTSSKRTVEYMCKKAEGSSAFLNLEGSTGNSAVVQRKGIIRYRFTVHGKATHSAKCAEGANAVAASSLFVLNIQAGLFSLLGLFAKAFLVDSIIESINTSKYFIVITTKREERSQYIINTLHHGVTVGDAVGEYTKNERTMIHTVCKRIEAVKLKKKIKEIDPGTFIIVTTSSEIIGRRFRSV